MGVIFLYHDPNDHVNSGGAERSATQLPPPLLSEGWELVHVEAARSSSGDDRIAWGRGPPHESAWLLVQRTDYRPGGSAPPPPGFDLVFVPSGGPTNPHFYVRQRLNRVHYPFCFIHREGGRPLIVLGCGTDKSLSDLALMVYSAQVGAVAVPKEKALFFSIVPDVQSQASTGGEVFEVAPAASGRI